jgi:hypothetical protein
MLKDKKMGKSMSTGMFFFFPFVPFGYTLLVPLRMPMPLHILQQTNSGFLAGSKNIS